MQKRFVEIVLRHGNNRQPREKIYIKVCALLKLQAHGNVKEIGSYNCKPGPQTRMLHQYISKKFKNVCMCGLKSLI